jgi:hypothetical protein
VGPKREATPIDGPQMENVRMLVSARVPAEPHPYLVAGQRVRIRSGALRGLEGILLRKTGDDHLVISIDTIQKSLTMLIDGYDLEILSHFQSHSTI